MKFKFQLERKVTMWVREWHEVEAETEQEAEAIMVSNAQEGKTDKTFLFRDEMSETITDTDVFEIYKNGIELIHDNF
jgi:hypothetical protein